MGIDEIRDLIDENLEHYIPEDYEPTDFNIVVSIDMDGVLAEFMTNADTYLPKLRELRPDIFNVPTSDNPVEAFVKWAQKTVTEITEYQGDVNRYKKEVEQSFGDVLKNFNSPPWLEPEYYRWLPPMEEMVKAMRCLSKVPQLIDSNGVRYNLKLKICSCAPTSEAGIDKCIWVSQHCPELDDVIIVPYDENNGGRNKAIALGLPVSEPGFPEPSAELIEHRQKTVFIHLDDNTKVLNGICKYGAEGVKCINGINDTHGSWKGPRIDICSSFKEIFRSIVPVLSNIAGRVMSERFDLENQIPFISQETKQELADYAVSLDDRSDELPYDDFPTVDDSDNNTNTRRDNDER